MAQRTTTELKVFLDGDLSKYQALSDKAGTVFFDKTNKAVYAAGTLIASHSQVKDITYDNDTTQLTITPFVGNAFSIDLGIQSEIDALKAWAEESYAKSAKVYKSIQVNNNELGGEDKSNKTLSITGNLLTDPNDNYYEDGVIDISFIVDYDKKDKKIHFRNGDTNATNLFTIDTTDFVKDGMISSVTYNESTKKLIITFNTDADKEQIEVDLSTLISAYTAGNGLSLSGNSFSVKLVSSNSYLDVSSDGLKVDINAIKSAVAHASTQARIQALEGKVTTLEERDYLPRVWEF